MSVQTVGGAIGGASTGSVGRLYLPGASEFSKTLNLGEVIKGKVLRHYEGSRYQVNFNGQERVVDSAVPLRTGEVIHGRVIGIGDQVELQRVYQQETRGSVPSMETGSVAKSNSGIGLFGRSEATVEQLVAQYQAKLSATDKDTLVRAVRGADNGEAMTLVGLVAAKLGMRQSVELLNAMYRSLLSGGAPNGLFAGGGAAQQLELSVGQSAGIQQDAVRQLADGIRRSVEQIGARKQSDRETDIPDAHDRDRTQTQQTQVESIQDNLARDPSNEDSAARLAHWVLNAQTQGLVAHRLGTVPLLVNGRLIEVDIALFEQQRDLNKEGTDNPATRHRQIVFSLGCEALGRVELVAQLSGDRVRVQITTDSAERTAILSEHMGELKEALAAGGWTTDELRYQTAVQGSEHSVVRTVIEHIISQDSLNRRV